MKARKDYLNKLQDLEGNIRVFCRLRPRHTIDQDTPLIVEVEDDYTVKFLNDQNHSTKTFNFDSCMRESTSNLEVFNACKNILKSGMDG
jgi:kinesin family protein C2/C3